MINALILFNWSSFTMDVKPDTHQTLCDPALLARREEHFRRLDALYANKKLDQPFILQGVSPRCGLDPYVDPEGWLSDCLDDLASRAKAALDPEIFRPLVLEFNPYGVHFIDRIFGARVFRDEDGMFWSDPLPSAIGELGTPDLETNATWLEARHMAEIFLQQQVSVPLFGLPTIASAVNIAINLYGEKFLLALYDDPQAARHDLRVINDLLCRLHRWYLTGLPIEQLQPVVPSGRCQPRGFGQICGCSNHLLSTRMYRDFFAELDDELLSVYPHGGMIHLCGDHTRHIPLWRAMKSLRAVQINDRAAEDMQEYFNNLRDDQIIYLNPTETMTEERALAISGGSRLVIIRAS
jgi:hypothetical protein